ncbi:protein of unknown function [Nitratireductor aquimarinus]
MAAKRQNFEFLPKPYYHCVYY